MMAEEGAERLKGVEPAARGDVGDADVGAQEQVLGVVEAPFAEIVSGRDAEFAAEEEPEMAFGDAGVTGDVRERGAEGEIPLDVGDGPLDVGREGRRTLRGNGLQAAHGEEQVCQRDGGQASLAVVVGPQEKPQLPLCRVGQPVVAGMRQILPLA